MLTISGVSKSYGGRTLFENATLQVNRGDRIGLVGPNGAGKSTLFGLILDEEQPDDGQITMQRNVSLGYLPQESAPAGDETVLELAMAISDEMVETMKILKAGEGQEHPPENYHEAQAAFDDLGGYQVESRAKQILAGLSFRQKDFTRPAREMSGGWVMRAHLARLLVQEPDLLMLDEPTNHLDLEALLWFQEYLKGYPGAILMISHDREFLNQLVDSIVEIRQQQLVRFRGNYDEFVVQKEAADSQQLAAYNNQQKEIEHLMDFVTRFRAKASKAAQAQSKLKQVERMDRIEAPIDDSIKIKFSFPQPPRSGLRVIALKNIHFAYGQNVVYNGMDFEAQRGERLVLVGPNGAGKSTLLKILAGAIEQQSGERELGHNVRCGYFAQYRQDTLDVSRTILEEALDTPQRITEQTVRTILGAFLFRGDDVFKKISVLSGGEKSRLALVKLLLDPPNLLLMDEPTTHLDMPSIDALVTALKQYEGTLIFISHDVYFIKAIGNKVVHVNAGQLTHYAGDYQYYLDKTQATSARAALTSTNLSSAPKAAPAVKEPPKTKEQKRAENDQRQANSKERKIRQDAVHKLEKAIADLETRQGELAVELEKPETYARAGAAQNINRELSDVIDQLDALNKQWEAAAQRLAELGDSAA
jgi:ATP-binding cassette subfamily F protein 3